MLKWSFFLLAAAFALHEMLSMTDSEAKPTSGKQTMKYAFDIKCVGTTTSCFLNRLEKGENWGSHNEIWVLCGLGHPSDLPRVLTPSSAPYAFKSEREVRISRQVTIWHEFSSAAVFFLILGLEVGRIIGSRAENLNLASHSILWKLLKQPPTLIHQGRGRKGNRGYASYSGVLLTALKRWLSPSPPRPHAGNAWCVLATPYYPTWKLRHKLHLPRWAQLASVCSLCSLCLSFWFSALPLLQYLTLKFTIKPSGVQSKHKVGH